MPTLPPSLAHSRKVRNIVGITSILGIALTTVALLTGWQPGPPSPSIPLPDTLPPWEYTIDTWEVALGGDTELTSETYTKLNTYTDPQLATHHGNLVVLSRQTLLADITGTNRQGILDLQPKDLAPYWPTNLNRTSDPAHCTNVTITAVSPTSLPLEPANSSPTTQYAKSLVVFTGTCGDETYTDSNPAVRYVYFALQGDTWFPVRSWQVPTPPQFDTFPGATEPYEWELKQVPQTCATNIIRARITVVDAFTQMCTDAQKDEIKIQATSGYRTRTEQAHLFNTAVKLYGTPETARQYVAYADDNICTSKHCAALAINIVETPDAINWLSTPVACFTSQGEPKTVESCASNDVAVPRAAQYGFVAPLATSPGYLEFTLPIGVDTSSSLGTANCAPWGVPVANQVAAIFRCRLAREHIVGTTQDRVVAEALVISRCESGWNPTGAAFGGRFATEPHPISGKVFTHRGVFMLQQHHVDAGWITESQLTDAVANINSAASLWLTTRSWDEFGCARGDPAGFEHGPVLPQYGGPPLPDWAFAY